MTKAEIIKKLVDIDATLNEQRYNRTMSAEEMRKLRRKSERLEKHLYK